jgi:SAM-dependent methyltransferase
MEWQDIPVFIVNRNRLEPMRQLIAWLRSSGTRNIVILDNQSTYPPLLEYYASLTAEVHVIRSAENHGPHALWQRGAHKDLSTPYIVTDSDLVPADFCPRDLVSALLDGLQRFPDAGKVGPGLRIDNLPESYREVDTVRKWEAQYWAQPVGDGFFAAAIDTTFALYPKGAEFSLGDRNIRLGFPYLMEHIPWYVDDAHLSAEDAYYRAHTSLQFSNWSVKKPDLVFAKYEQVTQFDRRPRVLHVGGGSEYIYGWINADARGRLLDLHFDPAHCGPRSLALDDDSIDGIYMSSSFSHIADVHGLLNELYRVAKPNARFAVRLPHGSSDSVWEDPRTVRPYFETSFGHFAPVGRANHPADYSADWQVERVQLSISGELRGLAELEALKRTRRGRNLVREMLVTLRAVKPIRDPIDGRTDIGELILSVEPRLPPVFPLASKLDQTSTCRTADKIPTRT